MLDTMNLQIIGRMRIMGIAAAGWLLAALWVGDGMVPLILPKEERKEKKGEGGDRKLDPWMRLGTASLAGTLVLGWLTYFLAYWSAWAEREPMLTANAVAIPVAILAGTAMHYAWPGKRNSGPDGHERNEGMAGSRFSTWKPCRNEIILFICLLGFTSFTMWYVFHVSDNTILSGYTVFSDYAPHTAMIRSFSKGANFPTQYPHFGGEDVKYHFMFQFLAGNLEWLGMRIDFAYNVPSAWFLALFAMALSRTASRLGAGKAGQVLAPVFLFFRSGTALFQCMAEHAKAGDMLEFFRENTTFLGYTQNESWGFWNYNVYLNQRHLAFGLLAGCIAIYAFLPHMEAGMDREKAGIPLFSRTAWKPIGFWQALAVGLMLGACAFWNGAAVIGTLLVLAGMTLASYGKLDYAVAALAAIILSSMQARFFIDGSVVAPSLRFGFLADQPTMPGCVIYLFMIFGPVIVFAPAAAMALTQKRRWYVSACLLPVIFSFTVSLTPDIAVNEKYLMLAYAYLCPVWAAAVDKLFHARKGKPCPQTVAILLSLCLIATGAYDFAVILKDNGNGRALGVDLNSSVTRWLEENTTHEDLILTPMYSMNEVTYSGAMLYCGWPYYAWSAGYDTDWRGMAQYAVYMTDDPEAVREITRKEKITYIVMEEGETLDGEPINGSGIIEAFDCVFQDETGRFSIYQCG